MVNLQDKLKDWVINTNIFSNFACISSGFCYNINALDSTVQDFLYSEYFYEKSK